MSDMTSSAAMMPIFGPSLGAVGTTGGARGKELGRGVGRVPAGVHVVASK